MSQPQPKRYLFVDPKGMPCVWVIVRGRIEFKDGKADLLRGEVIQRGPNFAEGETHSLNERDSGCSYVLGFAGTSWTALD